VPQAIIRNIAINYEVVGDHGPWIALTPGSRRSYKELLDLSKDIASSGYRVLLHDRRNCGSSGVGFDATASEHEVWADDLHELANQLGALPLLVGGSSAGARLAILFAIRHPKAIRGLLIWRLTGGKDAVLHLAHEYYGQFITLASEGGMEAIAKSEHFNALIQSRPSNLEKILETSTDFFIQVMSHWRDCFLASSNLPIVGATEDQLKNITVPVCLIAGNDVIHTPVTARKASQLFPNCEIHEDVVTHYPDDQLLKEWDRQEWRDAEPKLAKIFTSFLAQRSIQ
jgi:pimeloyl-ACP methyl ester carboxylesterase